MSTAQIADEGAYRRLVEPHRRELHAHCYRMLGSVHDADDALQEALVRAWRGLERFEGRSSLRSWLYRIATNTCLDTIARRPKRVLPVDHVPAVSGETPPGEPLVESVWIEPYPDEQLGLEDGYAAPEARYEQREAVELAFIAALQHLPARQRAVLILREVLGYSASEVAELLETTPASVNSAMQRARAAVEERLPERTQQATLRAIGDAELRELVDRYVSAWEAGDVETVVEMLAEDAAFSMPPLSTWYGPRDQIITWLKLSPMSGNWTWKARLTQASGQPAIGFYSWNEDERAYVPFAINVLTFREDGTIGDVVAFIGRTLDVPDAASFERFPDQAPSANSIAPFERFGLPERLT